MLASFNGVCLGEAEPNIDNEMNLSFPKFDAPYLVSRIHGYMSWNALYIIGVIPLVWYLLSFVAGIHE